jgi:2,4-dienoyl-CoA reductase-like NADH-dependent reductase (Old Yellow Enzyme family)
VSAEPARCCAPGRIGAVEIANRIVMPAMAPGLVDAEGFFEAAAIAWYEARASSGAGPDFSTTPPGSALRPRSGHRRSVADHEAADLALTEGKADFITHRQG